MTLLADRHAPVPVFRDDAIVAICKRHGEPDWTATMVRTTASDGPDFRRSILQWRQEEAPDKTAAEAGLGLGLATPPSTSPN